MITSYLLVIYLSGYGKAVVKEIPYKTKEEYIASETLVTKDLEALSVIQVECIPVPEQK